MASAHNTTQQKELWTRDFLLITLGNLFIFLGFQMLLPIMPVFALELGGTEAWAGMVTGIFTLASVIMRPITGRLLDRQGRKGVYLGGLLLFFLCMVAYHWVPGIVFLLLLRFIHGFGWGASSTASSTIATDIIPKARMGEGMGYFGLTGTLAMAVGPALSLGLAGRYGYNTVFTIATASVVIALVFALLIRYQEPEGRANPDLANKQSIFEKTALRPGVTIAFITMSYGGVVSFIALYAAQRQVENIGLFFTVYAIALMISRPVFGKLSDRKGYSFAILPGMIGVSGAMLLLFFAHTLAGFVVAGFIYGLGFGALQPALQAMAVRNVPPSRRGAANATFFLGFDLGIGVGAMLWGAVAELVGYQAIYLWALLPIGIAFVIYWKARHTMGL